LVLIQFSGGLFKDLANALLLLLFLFMRLVFLNYCDRTAVIFIRILSIRFIPHIEVFGYIHDEVRVVQLLGALTNTITLSLHFICEEVFVLFNFRLRSNVEDKVLPVECRC
jgi:hypothetical protein